MLPSSWRGPAPWRKLWRALIVLALGVLIGLTGCEALSLTGGTPSPAPSRTPTSAPSVTPNPSETPAGPTTLQVWLPPRFDPQGDTAAGDLLAERLDEFTSRRAGVSVEVRLKAESGPGGLLDALSSANAAAPLALPDLIIMPRAVLETAALKGFLFPLDNISAAAAADDWYAYAQGLGRIQDSTFGLPFAGDALVMLYRPAQIETPPGDWPAALELSQPIAFPAADPQALFTLLQYMASGGRVQDEDGRPVLDADVLLEVLRLYEQAAQTGLMPTSLTQYTAQEQSWEAYQADQVDMVVSWLSRYLSELPVDTSATHIPTTAAEGFTFANGWVVALANPRVERHDLAIQLAEFLVDGDFLAAWTETAGYLPPRSSALAGWTDATLKSLVNRIVRTAQVIPPSDVLNVVSPALEQATVDVLKDEADPESAAQAALEQLTAP